MLKKAFCLLPFTFFLRLMRIWIDLANSPHVPFFRTLIPEFVARGHQVEITARDFAQTVELAMKAGMLPHVIGGHGGRSITGKAGNLRPYESGHAIAGSISRSVTIRTRRLPPPRP